MHISEREWGYTWDLFLPIVYLSPCWLQKNDELLSTCGYTYTYIDMPQHTHARACFWIIWNYLRTTLGRLLDQWGWNQWFQGSSIKDNFSWIRFNGWEHLEMAKRGRLGGAVVKRPTSARSQSRGPWVRAPRLALGWWLGAWSLFPILCLPLSLCPSPVHALSLSVPKINKTLKKKLKKRGAWVAQSVKRRLQSGHDLTVREFEPRVWLWADGSEPGACFRFCVSLSLCPSPVHALSLSVPKINKKRWKKN